MATSKQFQVTILSGLTYSAEGILVSPSVKPESEPEKTTHGIFGRSSRASFAFLDPDSSCWKTSQATFLLGLDEFSETWPDAGTMRSGSVYEHLTSERPTCASASSSWPTASASVANDGETLESWEARRDRNLAKHTNGNGMGTPLTIAAIRWPTARSEDGESCGNHPGSTDSLTGATRNWPTAQAHDSRGPKTPAQIEAMRAKGPGVRNLNEEVSTWASPSAHDGRRPGSDETSTQGANLKRDAERWPTPNTITGGGETQQSRKRRRIDSGGTDLQAASEHWLTPHGLSPQGSTGRVGGCGGGEFGKQATQWGTPQAHKRTHDPREVASGIQLANQANNWQTPATDSFRSRGGDRKEEMGLDQQARMFPTPSARDYRTPNAKPGSERGMGTKGEQLPNFIEHHLNLHQDPAIPDGPPSSGTGPTSLQLSASESLTKSRLLKRRLNPRFVEFLMGFPIGWTEVD